MVRPALPQHLQGINRIENWAVHNTVAHFGLDSVLLEETQASYDQNFARYPWFVKEEEGEVIGFARAAPWKPRAAYQWTTEIGVYVDPGHHGKGIGKELYSELLPELERRGYRCIVAGITLPNEPSVRLHEAFGMKQVADFPSMGFKNDAWHPVGYWSKILGEGSPVYR